MTDPTNPLIVQGDLSVLVEVASPRFDEARSQLARFAELEKSPEHVHFYRLTSKMQSNLPKKVQVHNHRMILYLPNSFQTWANH